MVPPAPTPLWCVIVELIMVIILVLIVSLYVHFANNHLQVSIYLLEELLAYKTTPVLPLVR